MQRDIGNELIVAIAAVAVLAFALVFGIVLSLSSAAGEAEATLTITFVSSNVAAATESVVVIGSVTSPSTTTLPRETPPRPTPVPTNPVSDTVDTEEAPNPPRSSPTKSLSLTPQSTKQALQVATDTPLSTDTLTPVPTVQTPTMTSSPLPSQTPTPLPPVTTQLPVDTEEGGTLVFAQPTRSVAETMSTTPRPTLAVLFGTPAPTAAVCSSPVDWVQYTVQPNDTIDTLARATASTVDDLRQGNCLDDERLLEAGDVVLVPSTPVVMILPGETIIPGVLYVEGCTLPTVQITQPTLGQVLSGAAAIEGSADIAGSFGGYRLELFQEHSADIFVIGQSTQAVMADVLGSVDTRSISAGQYWIRLVVVDTVGNTLLGGTCAIPVTVN